jgi:hypothetical protein
VWATFVGKKQVIDQSAKNLPIWSPCRQHLKQKMRASAFKGNLGSVTRKFVKNYPSFL